MSPDPTPNPLAWLEAEAHDRASAGLTRRLTPFGPAQPGRLISPTGNLLSFASNDYLGLAADPRLAEAAAEAACAYGWGSSASALVCGYREPHDALARALAEFEQAESVLLFPTGYAANLGAIAALAGPGDVVYLDRLNHSCLVSGAKLSGATLRVYDHANDSHLRRILARDSGRFRRILIATDGVFSMDGDLAPLPDLADLADEHNAMLLVDEAHGTGVFGPDGRGAASALGVAHRVPIRVGTLSKALGSIGGFVAGSALLIDHLLHRAPTFAYSTALPPAAAAAASKALEISLAEPWRRFHVHAIGSRLRQQLRDRGFQVPPSEGPIVPLLVGDPAAAVSLANKLWDAGLLVPAIRPPTVPKGTSRLRISLTAAHTDDDLDLLLRLLT